MRAYFFSAGVESADLDELENRIRDRLPAIRRIKKLDELTQELAGQGGEPQAEKIYVIFPVLTAQSSLDRLVSIAEQDHQGIFFIFVSKEISASDYKRLVRGGGADWASLGGAPQEIADIVFRKVSAEQQATASAQGAKPAIATFVPSSGGVGNTTLALETAIQLKQNRPTRNRRICLLDLDLQTSHVCDYLDIEPRLQIQEIVAQPERLDAQLFGLFVSPHSSGLEVLAAPRNRRRPFDLNIGALDALFGMIASRYDLLIIDLPPLWFPWTEQILSVSDLAVVTGLNTVPGLRQVAGALQSLRDLERVPLKIVVALNRCKPRLLGGVANQNNVRRVLGQETVLFVREDAASAEHALNTGIPIATGARSSKISKDIQGFASLMAQLRPQAVSS